MVAPSLKPLGELLRDQARATPDNGAIWFEGRVTSYAELDHRSDKIARGMLALGVKPGERVVFLAKNSDSFFEILFGGARVGVVTAPLNWRLAAPELVAVINDSGAGLLFVGPEFYSTVSSVISALSTVRSIIAMEPGSDHWLDFKIWRDSQADSPSPELVKLGDPVLQLYTSGTTGLPKGVVLTHRSLLAMRDPQLGALAAWNQWSADDVSLLAMPVFHVAGAGTGLTAICSGSGSLTVILREFSAGEVFAHLERDWLTKMFLVPAGLLALVNHPGAGVLEVSKLRYILYGASPMPLDLLKRSMEVFHHSGFIQVYGLTEVSGYVVVLSPEDHLVADPALLRSAGRAMAGVELKVIDDCGDAAPANHVGEIHIRSDATMDGYWRQPQATSAVIDGAGWLHTGDAGYLDGDGYLFIQDRVKDMIVSGGENVYPAEVENAIFGCPGVADVAVVGVPDKTWGEAVKAIVVPHAGAAPTSEEIIAWCRARIAGYKLPKSVDYIESLPRNASGKVLRRVLREAYWQGAERRVN